MMPKAVALVLIGLLLLCAPTVTAQAPNASSVPTPLDRAGLPPLPAEPAARTTAQAPAPAQPTALSDIAPWARLVYESYRDDNWDVYWASGDGSGEVRVTTDAAVDGSAVLNRGGTRIAFASERAGHLDVYTVDPDGSGLSRLTTSTTDDVRPAWSPDGAKIALQREIYGDPEVYVMNADGSTVRRLTTSTGFDGLVCWSPDGTQLAFTSERGTTDNLRVWVMAPNGANPRRLSDQAFSAYPAWSPDGARIAYSADGDGNHFFELWVMNADGSDQHRVLAPGSDTEDLITGSWSPDGRYIAFTRVQWIYYDGDYYWTTAFIDAWDSATDQVLRLTAHGTEWDADWQTLDVAAPGSQVSPLPAVVPGPVAVTWGGADEGPAGIAAYDVQVKDGDGPWTDWLVGVPETADSYPGSGGHTYAFRSRARDRAWNVEPWPDEADAVATVEALPPHSRVRPLPAYTRGEATVQWLGYDRGGSGVARYEVEFADDATGTWTAWLTATQQLEASFAGEAGHSYRFRVRAVDQAHNQGDWSGAEAMTFYRWRVEGIMADARGVPLPTAALGTAPAALNDPQSDPRGAYRGYYGEGGEHLVAPSKGGYGDLPDKSLPGTDDVRLDAFLPPTDDRVADGQFEVGLESSAWHVSGEVAAVVTDTQSHSGDGALFLGAPYAPGPVENATDSPGGMNENYAVAVDSANRLHLVWSEGDEGAYEVRHAVRLPGGPWSGATTVSAVAASDGTEPALAIDDHDTLHVVWGDVGAAYYAFKPADGDWSAPAAIPGVGSPAYHPQLVTDRDGGLHLVVDHTYSLRYHRRDPDGTWSTPTDLGAAGGTTSAPKLAIGPDGTLHLLYMAATPTQWQVFYVYRAPQGAWSLPVALTDGPVGSGSADLAVDPLSGRLEVVYRVFGQDGYTAHQWRTTDGQWSDPEVIGEEEIHGLSLGVAPSGQLYLAYIKQHGFSGDQSFYVVRSPEGAWSEPQALDAQGALLSWGSQVLIDRSGLPHFFWGEYQEPPDYQPGQRRTSDVLHRPPAPAPVTAEGILAQTIDLPATLHAPTLSFVYQGAGLSPDGGRLEVAVSDGVSAHSAVSITEPATNWGHAWADLSGMVGRPVTVTLRLTQVAGQAQPWVAVDEVTVGSWLTPWPRAVQPSRIEAQASTVVTVTGENLGAVGGQAPQVLVGASAATEVIVVDEGTLKATLPPLAPGSYDLVVRRMDGQEAALPASLLVGKALALPAIWQSPSP